MCSREIAGTESALRLDHARVILWYVDVAHLRENLKPRRLDIMLVPIADAQWLDYLIYL